MKILRSIAAALLGIALPEAAKAQMTFQVETDQALAFGEVATQGFLSIYATGQIAAGDTERFVAFVRSRKLEVSKVVFDSPGGSLSEGMRLGRAIRKLGFYTAVGRLGSRAAVTAPICASACAYAYAGGVARFLDQNSRAIGLHQFRSGSGPGASEGDAQVISGVLVAYLTEMGVDATAFALAAVTEPNGMVWLTLEDALALRFVNNGIEPTTAEIKITSMRPYLRLNQERFNSTSRLIFLCWERRLSVQAGIVTDEEQSKSITSDDWIARSYLELDGSPILVVSGKDGAKANRSTVWLEGELTPEMAGAFLRTNEVGIWLDGHGMVRMGTVMDLRPVRAAMNDYFKQCLN